MKSFIVVRSSMTKDLKYIFFIAFIWLGPKNFNYIKSFCSAICVLETMNIACGEATLGMFSLY